MSAFHAHVDYEPGWAEAMRAELAVSVTFGSEVDSRTTFLVCGRPDRGVLDALPNLQVVIVPYAGVPAETRAILAERPHLRLFNLHHNAIDTAEMALALLMAASRRLHPLSSALHRGDWSQRYQTSDAIRLHGKRALILGYGSIGRHIGSVLRAMGMTVTGVRRHASNEPNVFTLEHLDDLIPEADVLVVALPLTPETEGLVNAERLARLPERALVVNVGRGPIIDEAALFEALKSGRVAGAGLDVWWRYPGSNEERADCRPSNLPFHELPNCVMTPHVGGATDASELDRCEALVRLLNDLAAGIEVHGVDVTAGY